MVFSRWLADAYCYTACRTGACHDVVEESQCFAVIAITTAARPRIEEAAKDSDYFLSDASSSVFNRFSSLEAMKYLSSKTVSIFRGFALPTDAAQGYSA